LGVTNRVDLTGHSCYLLAYTEEFTSEYTKLGYNPAQIPHEGGKVDIPGVFSTKGFYAEGPGAKETYQYAAGLYLTENQKAVKDFADAIHGRVVGGKATLGNPFIVNSRDDIAQLGKAEYDNVLNRSGSVKQARTEK